MTHHRTKWGLIEQPPSVERDDEALDEWREEIDAALDTARQVTERERALKAADGPDKGRFSALGDQ